ERVVLVAVVAAGEARPGGLAAVDGVAVQGVAGVVVGPAAGRPLAGGDRLVPDAAGAVEVRAAGVLGHHDRVREAVDHLRVAGDVVRLAAGDVLEHRVLAGVLDVHLARGHQARLDAVADRVVGDRRAHVLVRPAGGHGVAGGVVEDV